MGRKGPEWKPVQIEGNLLAKGAVEGLVGIEECTDYDSEQLNSKKTGTKRKKQNVKRSRKKQKIDKHEETILPSKSGNTTSENNEVNIDEEVNLEAWKAYNLPDAILRALADLSFINPTKIQALTLPASVLGRKDILGAAETGSGKTLAFAIPILTGILKIQEKENVNSTVDDSDESDFENDSNSTGCVKSVKLPDENRKKPLYALILTPTRELAVQVKNHMKQLAKYTNINVALVVGGMAEVKQERILGKYPEIVVATPGRLWELIQKGNSHLSQIDSIKFLAIDETDRMLERGHFSELQELLERINIDELRRCQRQNFVFSATLTLVHDLPNYLKTKGKFRKSKNIENMTAEQKLTKIVELIGMNNPKVVDITEGKGTSETLTETKIVCKIDEKDYYVYYFLKKHPGRTLIFCNSIGCVKRLSHLLSLLNCKPLPLHASMQQRQRLKNLDKFKDDENGILVATDVAARGLDIPNVEHVLHYQTPRTSESYVHRSGRTARASKMGITVLLIEPNELTNYLKLCRTLEKRDDLPNFPIQQVYLNAVKDIVNLARKLDKLEFTVKKINSENGWLQKAAEEMDIIVDDYSRKFDHGESKPAKKLAELQRKELNRLLAKPIFVKGFDSEGLPTFNLGDQQERALDAVKNVTEIKKEKKKRKVRLFKPNKSKNGKNKGFDQGKIKIGKKFKSKRK